MNHIDNRPEQPDIQQWSALVVTFIIIGAVIVWGLLA